MLPLNTEPADRRAVYRAERDHARRSFARDQVTEGWHHLERAHVLAQPDAIIHISSHLAMLRRGVIERDTTEIVGQVVRAILAGPASLTGRIPTGNNGRARTSLSKRMAIPTDLEPHTNVPVHPPTRRPSTSRRRP
jgi:hypothetical protein